MLDVLTTPPDPAQLGGSLVSIQTGARLALCFASHRFSDRYMHVRTGLASTAGYSDSTSRKLAAVPQSRSHFGIRLAFRLSYIRHQVGQAVQVGRLVAMVEHTAALQAL